MNKLFDRVFKISIKTTKLKGRMTALSLLSSSGQGDMMLYASANTSEVKSIIGHSSIDAVPIGAVEKSTS